VGSLWRVGLLVGGVLLALGLGAACGGESETVTVAGEPLTVTETETVTETVTKTVKVTPKPPSVKRFSGNGGKTIRVRVAKDSTFIWTNDGDIFQVFDEDFEWAGINSQAHRGDSFIPAGNYTLTVNAIGNWTITIR
jgi:hypothetical protein